MEGQICGLSNAINCGRDHNVEDYRRSILRKKVETESQVYILCNQQRHVPNQRAMVSASMVPGSDLKIVVSHTCLNYNRVALPRCTVEMLKDHSRRKEGNQDG